MELYEVVQREGNPSWMGDVTSADAHRCKICGRQANTKKAVKHSVSEETCLAKFFEDEAKLTT